MGSVVIIFLPVLLPIILIMGIAGRFGYDPLEVIFAPFTLMLEAISALFFGGNDEAVLEFFASVMTKIADFCVENADIFESMGEKSTEWLDSVIH